MGDVLYAAYRPRLYGGAQAFMAEFVTVALIDELPPGGVLERVVGGEEIAIFNCDGTLYAINNICSHAYAHLSEGELDTDDCRIECPLHGAIFDLATGKPRTLPAVRPVATYVVQVIDGVVQVAVA